MTEIEHSSDANNNTTKLKQEIVETNNKEALKEEIDTAENPKDENELILIHQV